MALGGDEADRGFGSEVTELPNYGDIGILTNKRWLPCGQGECPDNIQRYAPDQCPVNRINHL